MGLIIKRQQKAREYYLMKEARVQRGKSLNWNCSSTCKKKKMNRVIGPRENEQI